MAAHDLDSPLAQKIKQQIQFYFSDSNYPRDKFLRGKAAENDGWVPIDVIATFSRMKSMTTDLSLVVAITKSIDELVVSEDSTKVKRKSPIPEKDTINERSIYVKGLPDAADAGVNIETVTDFFSKFGKVLSVRLRRDQDKSFKGKAYIEFATVADAEAAAKNKDLAWGENKTPIETFTKNEYFEARKEKSKAVKDEKKRKREDGGEKEKSEKKDAFASGLVLELKGVPSTTERDIIKDLLSAAGVIRYVDFHGKDLGVAFIRFTNAEGAKTALADVTAKKIKIGEAELVGRILEGEEEKKYWAEKVTPFTTGKPKQGNRSYGSFKKHRKE